MSNESNETISELINFNSKICTLLGMTSALLFEIKHNLPQSEHWKFEWIDDAIQNVIYLKKPIPPMPRKDLL